MSDAGALIKLEVCVDNVHGLAAAVAGGADRIELCAALEVGGLTPSPGLMWEAASCALPVYAMVRPRAGHFRFDEAEVRLMLGEIDAIRDAGLAGVVLGAATADGRLDHKTLERLLRRADGLGCTLHRVIDLCPDLAEATRTALELGFERILTSGGAASAALGVDGLQRCFEAADGRLSVMPGAGVGVDGLALLRARLPLREVHASCSEAVDLSAPQSQRELAFGFELAGRRQTSELKVRALRQALAG